MRTPELRSLGGRQGRAASYPPETLTQLLVIDELLRGKRDFDVVRWQLFLAGLAIPMKRLREQLHEELAWRRKDADEALTAFETEDDDVAQRYLDSLKARARKNARRPAFQVLNKRIGARAIPDFLEIAARFLAVGTDLMGPDEGALFARAMGLGPPGKISATDGDWLADVFNIDAMSRALDASTDETLRTVRSEFLQLVGVAKQVGIILPELAPFMALFEHRDPLWPPPSAFLFLLRNRDDPRIQSAALGFLEYLRKRFAVVPQ